MKKILIIGIIIFLVIAWNAIGWVRGEKIAVTYPMRGSAVQAVYATGTVEASVMLPLSSHISARLMELKVDEGSKVVKGQLLAQLEDSDLQQSIKQLEVREEFAKKEFERNEMLVKSKSVSRKNYEQTKADFEAAIAATKAAQAQADYLKLFAPADGLIIKRDGEVGQMIAANTPVFWLSCCAPLRITTEVDEEDISRVKIGQNVLIRADAFPKNIFHGKVLAITPKGDPIARSYRVRVQFTEDTPLQIGMTAETNIIINEKTDALLLPTSAVVNDKIWIVSEGRLMQRTVSTGAKGVEKTEIIDGVDMKELVVMKPDSTIQEGQKIHAVLTESAKP